jgi:tRNA (adenine37-N6)-methyltransferase
MSHEPSMLPMDIRPVGYVRSTLKDPVPSMADANIDTHERMKKIRERHRMIKTHESELLILPELANVLEGIEDFSHIVVLYWAHLVPPRRRSLQQVHPMGRKDFPLKGIFATRSPSRPNPVLVSTVRLLAREGNVLRVLGLEALDGSPIVDIKPYFREFDGAENPTFPSWVERMWQVMEGNNG